MAESLSEDLRNFLVPEAECVTEKKPKMAESLAEDLRNFLVPEDNNSNEDWEKLSRQKPSADSEIKSLDPELFLLTGTTKHPYVSNEMVLANSLLELRQRVYALEERIKINEAPIEKLKTVSNEEWKSMILASIHYGDIDNLGVSKNFMKLFIKDKFSICFSAHYCKKLNSALKNMVESNVLKVCSDQLYSVVDV